MKQSGDPEKNLRPEENAALVILMVDEKRRVQKVHAADPQRLPRPPHDAIGMLPGEVLCCRNALDFPGQCGRTTACADCGVNRTIREALRNGDNTPRRNVRFNRRFGNTTQQALFCVSGLSLGNRDKKAMICIEDLTEVESAISELRTRKAYLKSLFQASPIGLGFLEPEFKHGRITDRIIRDVNDKLCTMTGYAREELIGKSIRRLYAHEGEYDYVTRGAYAQFPHESMGTIETAWKTKHGQIRSISLSSAPLDPQDGSAGICFTATDITEQIKAREEREKLENRLRHTQKMEAVGELSGGIAHEFNNLLQIINGYADLMTDDLAENHAARPALNEILSAGDRAASLVRHLLAFSRKQVMQMMDIRINDLISKTIIMLKGLLGENVEIDFIPGHQIGLVHADPSQIEQVLVNLCVNARDAMPEGGTITIETENVLINGEYCRTHDWAQPGRFILVSVSDSGCGMDPYTASRAFEPFFTTKPPEKNNGLGLATAYGIVRQHEGMLNVYTEPGRGTMFKIYLPLVERRASEVGVNLKERVQGGSETILIGEDDEMVRNLMHTVLTRAGYTTLCAQDGQEAEQLFQAHADEIELALLDVVMPKKNGKQVNDAIKTIQPGIKTLFCSGYSSNAIHTNFVLHEGMELLQKPFAAEDLLRKVRQLLDSGKADTSA